MVKPPSRRTTHNTPTAKILPGRVRTAQVPLLYPGRRQRREAPLADEHEDVADAYVTLCVHAGIAASDVICCASLAEHALGESHDEAIGLLAKADKDVAKHLRTLLKLKTKAGYSHAPATTEDFKRAGRAAETLVEAARRVAMSANTR
jgi:hypothetical protein